MVLLSRCGIIYVACRCRNGWENILGSQQAREAQIRRDIQSHGRIANPVFVDSHESQSRTGLQKCLRYLDRLVARACESGIWNMIARNSVVVVSIHLAFFYISGKYYKVLNRVFGVEYLRNRRRDRVSVSFAVIVR